MEDWKLIRLGDVISIKSGFAYKGEYIGNGDAYLLGMGCVSYKDIFLLSGARKYNGEAPERYLAKPGDIVLATRQQSDNLPILGMPAMIPYSFNGEKVIIGANLYRVENHSDISNEFLFWLLKSPAYVAHIRSCQTGTTVRMITKANIEDFTFLCPPKSERQRIASTLWNIEKKIELNNRINHNLEEQAQALYKSWFVDFEPFKGGKFVKSELGMIPEGWRVGTSGELLEIRYGKDHKKLSDGPYPVYGSGGLMRKVERPLFDGESVLIPRKGSLNNVMYVNEAFWSVDTMFYSAERMPNVAKYSYQILSQLDLASMNSGSAVPSMTTDILNAVPVIIPAEGPLRAYNEIVTRLYTSIATSRKENIDLCSLRDSILPKLMSGVITC